MELAEEFADFFLNKILTIRKQFEDISPYMPTTKDIPILQKFAPMSEKEVKEIIMSMKTKCCELDALPTSLLKRMIDVCLPSITKIVNLSLETGQFTNQWKVAIIRPLLKKAGLDLVKKNYRPVSNLSFLSKVIEKAMLKQFNEHCDNYGLLPDYQSAYRSNYSCETSLLKLTNDILRNMESKQVTALVMMDLSAAFDTIDHELLLEILQHRYGISDDALGWYDNYLRPRGFKVCVGDSYSKERPLAFSVPEGSCSGAVLFIAYIESLSNIILHPIQLAGFADDHSIHDSFKPDSDRNAEKQTIDRLQEAMSDTKKWMDSVRLKLNSDKTEFIYFGTTHQLKKCLTDSIDVNGDHIIRSETVRYLGAFLDQLLNFKAHTKQKCRTAMSNLIRIRNMRKFLTKDTCATLMLGLVVSHLDYCNSILVGVPKVTLNQLQRIQNMAAKVTLGRDKSASANEALFDLHWLPVTQRINFKVATMVFKCLNGEAPKYLCELIEMKKPQRQGLRSELKTNDVNIPFVKAKTLAE